MAVHRPSIYCRIYLRPPQIGGDSTDAAQLVTFECEPLSMLVRRRSHVEADDWELAFDLEDFPFDPMLVRGATVEIFVADLAREAAQQRALDYWAGLSRDEERTHCVMAGVADEVANELSEEGRNFRLRGRDYTAYFLDSQLNAPIRWSTSNFAELIVQQIQSRATTQAIGLEIVVDGERVLFDTTKGAPTLEAQAATAGAGAGILNALKIRPSDYKPRSDNTNLSKRLRRDGEVVWEAIQEIALEAGFIAYVELDRIVLLEPQTLVPDQIRPEDVWTFTLGGDVSSYRPSRRLGRQVGIIVQVASFNPETGRTLVSRAPTDEEAVALVSNPGAAGPIGDAASKAGKAVVKLNVTPFVVRGITSQAQLDRIAKGILPQLEYHDIEIELETSQMVDSRGRAVWEMRYADPLVVRVSETLASVLAMTGEQQLQRLIDRGFEVGDSDSILGPLDAAGGFLAQQRLPFVIAEQEFRYTAESDSGWDVTIKARSRRQVTLEVTEGAEALAGEG